MNTITHQQAQRWLAVGQTDLPATENAQLTAHLAQCEACRTYARETLTLQQDLTRVMQARWDGQKITMTQPSTPKATARDGRLNLIGTLFGTGALAALTITLVFLFNRAPVQQLTALINSATVADLKPALYKTEAITVVAFSQRAGSNVMAVGYRDGRLELMEADTGQVRFSLFESGEITALAFAPQGQGDVIASLTREGTIILWAVDLTQSAMTLLGAPLSNPNPNATFFQIALSPDGLRLATLDSNGSVKVFNARPAPSEAPQFQIQFDFFSEATLAGDLAFSPDGRLLAVGVGTSSTVRVLNLETNQEAQTFTLPNDSQALWVEFTPDGQKLVVGGNPNAYLFDLASQQLLITFAGNPTWLTALRLSPDGKVLVTAADNDQSVRVWNAEDGTLLREIPFPDPVHSIDFSADGSQLAVLWYGADGNQLEIWNPSVATTPLAETPTPVPLPTGIIASTPLSTQDLDNLANRVQDVTVVWLPESQATPLPPSGFTFGADLTYTSDQDTIAHMVAFPLLANEGPAPCELRSVPLDRAFWANQTNFPPGTHTFSQSFLYNSDAFPSAAYLLVRVNVLDTEPVSNLLYCHQRIYPIEQLPVTPTLVGTLMPFPTFTPCAIGCETPPPFITTVPSPTPCLVGCTPTPIFTPVSERTPLAGCDVAWFFTPPLAEVCPRRSVITDYAVHTFERGYLIRLLHYDGRAVIYALYYDGTWVNYTDNWAEGLSDTDPSLVPPTPGYPVYVPRGALGYLWSQTPALRERIGWAAEPLAIIGTTNLQSEWRPEAPEVNVHTFFEMPMLGVTQQVHLMSDSPPPGASGTWAFLGWIK